MRSFLNRSCELGPEFPTNLPLPWIRKSTMTDLVVTFAVPTRGVLEFLRATASRSSTDSERIERASAVG